jgi:hypothetical protein
MTDPAPADPTPAPLPDPPPPLVDQASQRGRPSKVVERDLAVARTLAEREQSLHEVMATLGLEWRITYNSVCRLRDRGLVMLNRNGTRTPTWRVTDRGHEWLGTPAPTATPEPEVVEVEPVPPVEVEVVVEVPPPVEPEPVEVPTVVVPTPEPGAQPVPIEPPPPEEPVGVPPAPGAAEPVWPI